LSATHKNLAEAVANGNFREDLFYRLNVIELLVPPLRERQKDIPILVAHIIDKLAQKNDIDTPQFGLGTMEKLMGYSFPGNVRELENILERALTWAEDDTINVEDLMFSSEVKKVQPVHEQPKVVDIPIETPQSNEDLTAQLENQERALIQQALEETRWNKTAAAKKLGITFRALRYKLKKLNLD
jgi:two-component system response regulator PilR (NtrC family)